MRVSSLLNCVWETWWIRAKAYFVPTPILVLHLRRGLGTCVEVSIAGYPEIVRAQLAIPADFRFYAAWRSVTPDPDFSANKLHVGREAFEKDVVFLDS